MHPTCRLLVASALRLAATLALAATSAACIQIEVELPEICRTAQLGFTTPVPEPTTAGLLLAGLLLVSVRRGLKRPA